ncbi:hypothetical protein OIE13_04925 [Streptosporangium sp. NBC_01810]|uniref:DUF6879 family protein n=1 Tax=Streptosporangium sp. NBC_01810 TaxID=2975951 RepID=UPI002DD99617|nr:DUF6879 family protein [Streptosporangium sp. NBC_01810]WSA27225.1 hypothetical protein OIE13_04925 [Streptosporangium sp. NBC_01810]
MPFQDGSFANSSLTSQFDFLLFDRHAALIHDYGEIGLQSGGWMTHDPVVISSLEKKAIGLRTAAVPFEDFLAGV